MSLAIVPSVAFPGWDRAPPICEVCGEPVAQAPSGRGRPREHHSDCREIASALRRLSTALERASEGSDVRRKIALSKLVRRSVLSYLYAAFNSIKPNGSARKAIP